MSRTLALAFALVAAVAATPQQPQIQNGRVETRSGAIDREVAAAAARGGADATWVGWRVPMIDGERSLCCWYSDGMNSTATRGCLVEANPPGQSNVPKITPPSGPVPLEAGTGLVVLLRVVDGHIERLRTLSDDCPIDAGGRTIYWLDHVTPAESLAYLDGLTRRTDLVPDLRQRLVQSALSAIALHRDAGADAILDRLASNDADANLRRQAASALGSNRGAHGLASLRRLLEQEKTPELRRQLVSSIGQTRQPDTAAALRALLHDADARVRAEAVYWFIQRGGAAVLGEVTSLIDTDTDDTVRRRAVSGIAQLAKDDSVPALIQIARAGKNLVARKEAVTRLGESKDPRAIAFLEEILKR